MRKIVGIGETIMDIVFQGDTPVAAVPGGSVFNGLISLGRAGLPVTFISETGNDPVGRRILAFMEENGISSQSVNVFPEGKSPISLAFLDADCNADYVFYKDYPKCRLEVDFPTLEADDIVVFGSYFALNPVLRPRVAEFLAYARERGAIIYYDINFRSTHRNEAIKLQATIYDNFECADIVRGSDEDFMNMFGFCEVDEVYGQKVAFYCPQMLVTHGGKGVELRAPQLSKRYEVKKITPVSTIGAGDNFNAGILYGLMKYNIGREELLHLGEEKWNQLVACGIDFSAEVCQSLHNSVSRKFAQSYQLK